MRRLLPLLLVCAVVVSACASGEPSAAVTELPGTQGTTTATTPSTAEAPTRPSAGGATTGGAGSGSSGGSAGSGSGASGAGGSATGGDGSEAGGASGDGSGAEAGGASGDGSEPVRQPVRFEVGSVSVTPATVSIAPALPVELRLVNVDEGFHRLRLIGAGVDVTLQGGQRETRMLPGLEAGTYTLSVDGGKQVATLRVGDDAGP